MLDGRLSRGPHHVSIRLAVLTTRRESRDEFDLPSQGRFAVPRLSIIITALGNVELLEQGLVSVLQFRPADCEMIVMLDQAYDDPYNLRDEGVRYCELAAGSSRLDALNRGLALAQGEILHTLDCGAEVAENWADLAVQAFDDPTVGCVAPLIVDQACQGERVRSTGMKLSVGGKVITLERGRSRAKLDAARQHPAGPSLLAAFYRATALESLRGAFDPYVGAERADIDLGLRLQAAGFKCAFVPDSVVSIDSTLLAPCSGDAQQASRELERLFWRHRSQSPLVQSLAAHALLLGLEACAALLRRQLVATVQGRMLGAIDALLGRGRTAVKPARSATVREERAVRELPSSLRLDSAHRLRGRRESTSGASRPLRRSA